MRTFGFAMVDTEIMEIATGEGFEGSLVVVVGVVTIAKSVVEGAFGESSFQTLLAMVGSFIVSCLGGYGRT